jgi:hypothetical protein
MIILSDCAYHLRKGFLDLELSNFNKAFEFYHMTQSLFGFSRKKGIWMKVRQVSVSQSQLVSNIDLCF